MVKLRCESLAEHASIPAFIFFFQMLYPFSWVNRPAATVAAAAGGCMLVRADALAKAGGIDAIRTALIDDCALAKALKAQGPIWLGLTDRVHSIRPYPDFADIRRMVARSAYAQLRYSPLLLAGTVVGHATHLPCAAAAGAVRQRRRAGDRHRRLAADGGRLHADLAILPRSRSIGALRCLLLRSCTCCSPSIPPTSMCEDEAEAGRGGRKPTCRVRDDDCCRIAIGQGAPGREFSGRFAR